MVYEAFTDMVIKLKANQADLLGTLIRQIEAMQDRTSRNQERIRQIDKEIADLGAKNLVITRLHTSGVLDAADYAKQTSEIGNRITDLRIERRKKLTEDEDDILLDTLKALNGILEEYEPTAEFDNDLFEQIVQDITVNDNTQITFRLLGDIQLTEKINEKGRWQIRMKNRTLPYGYQCCNGITVPQPQESEIVKRICESYLNGQSLLTIASWLNEEQIEYMPGVIGWNKARLKRIIEDERYLGKEPYPAILAEETYTAMQQIKEKRNTQKDTDRKTDIFQIAVPVKCPNCGKRLIRRHDSRCKIQQRWICENKELPTAH